MLPFENLISIDKQKPTPAFRQITDQLIALIRTGRLKPGIFLPGTRQMAQMLCVNRKTIIKSYDEMLGQNWIETILRKGYRVMTDLPLLKPRSFQPRTSFSLESEQQRLRIQRSLPIIDQREIKQSDLVIDDGFPDPGLSPCKEINRVFGEDDKNSLFRQLLPQQPQGGLHALKEATSTFLNDTRALNISTREIMMTRGGNMGLYLAANILLEKGDQVALSATSDLNATGVFQHAGAQLLFLRSDEQGIDTEHLEMLLVTNKIKLLYIMPHCHYPTTVVMSAQRRRKLLELMICHRFWVVEDDNGYDFHYQGGPILPLASSAHNGRLIYIGSFERTLCTPARVGFFVAPPEIINRANRLQGLIDLHGDTYMELLLLRIITNGGLERHIMRSRKMYAHRCESICAMLDKRLGNFITYEMPKAGLSIYISFNASFPFDKFIEETTAKGLFFNGIVSLYNGEKAIRFGFASLSIKEMEKAIEVMDNAANHLIKTRRNYLINRAPIGAISA
jgi:GntR family transcriptional regulator/MocR family aminotransferase